MENNDAPWSRMPDHITGTPVRALRAKPSLINTRSYVSVSAILRAGPDRCARKCDPACATRSIVVFHDSEKAYPRLQAALPAVLDHFGGLAIALNPSGLQNRPGNSRAGFFVA